MTKFVAPGQHLLIDFFEAHRLEDEKYIENALRDAANACGATVLKIMLHHFGDGAGVTGVALLAESHISIHTWPEINFAAIDVFLCGKCTPTPAVTVLKSYFNPGHCQIKTHERGHRVFQTETARN